MNFAFDYDDVISAEPDFFSVITQALKKQGHMIYVLTDFDEYYRKQRESELKKFGISYDELVINSNKSEYCKKHNIDYAIDDLAEEYYPDLKLTNLSIVKINQ